MKSIFRKNRRSLSLAPAKDDSQSENTNSSKESQSQRPFIRDLIKPAYDSLSIKHSWLLAAINVSSPLENPDNAFRLYRVELRGSHVLLYRPPPNFGIKGYKIESPDSSAVQAATSLYKLPSNSTLLDSTNNQTTPPTNAPRTPENPPKLPDQISYFSCAVPHPELLYDSKSNVFLPSNETEPLVHYLLFAPDVAATSQAVSQLITVFPILPTFSECLKYLLIMLVDVFNGSFGEIPSVFTTAHRVTRLLDHVIASFPGLLLNHRLGNLIGKILDLLHDNLSPESTKIIASFKDAILAKQTSLLLLTSSAELLLHNHHHQQNIDDPYSVLSSSFLLKEPDLYTVAKVISQIDLHFFRSWNSSIDKSLLLSSLVCDRSVNSPDDNSSSSLAHKKNPLVFNNDANIHFLARLLVHHLFFEDPLTKTAEKRARILERWIDLGCLLDKSGNMSSWLGISSVILSQPILRLSSIWCHVDPEYIKLVKNDWSPVLFELDRRYLANSNERIRFGSTAAFVNGESDDGDSSSSKESYHIMTPRGLGKIYSKDQVIPYFGDLMINNSPSALKNLGDIERIWKKVNYSFDKWNDYLDNLSDSPEIIAYNQANLRRYNSMGFVMSNEGLNQVLYLGVNKDEKTLTVPEELKSCQDEIISMTSESSSKIRTSLVRLLEQNETPITLEDIMDHSLRMEPADPEKYLNLGDSSFPSSSFNLPYPRTAAHLNASTTSHHTHNNSSSNISIHSGSSGYSTTLLDSLHQQVPQHQHQQVDVGETMTISTPQTTNTISEVSPVDKLPLFNNNYFKIDIGKYDDLVPGASANPNGMHPDDSLFDDHRIVVNNELTLRIDDFVPDFDVSLMQSTENLPESEGNEGGNGANQGLGIDVDDILNPDKFRRMSTSEENQSRDNEDKENEQPRNSETDPSGGGGDEEKLKDKPRQRDSKDISGKRMSRETRHRSFGLVSNYSTNRSSRVSLTRYIPRFASMDTLVDLMLIDSCYFDDVHPIALSEYRFVFMLNYTSFMTTKELLDKLAHRFVHSGNAVISIMKKQSLRMKDMFDPVTFGAFPNWEVDEKVNLADLGDVDYELLLKIQINILKSLLVLLNSFYGNFASDLRNKRMMIQFFKLYSNEILQWYNSSKIDRGLDKHFEDLVSYYKKLKKLFVKKTYRPVEPLKFHEFLIHEARFSNTLPEVPMNRNLPSHRNVNKIEKFLNKFNKLLTMFYKGIKPEDWFRAFKVMENQFEKTSLLNHDHVTPMGTPEDQLGVSNIFTYFDTIKDASDGEFLKLKFPLVFKKLFQLYYKFKCYLFIQLSDSNISTDERLDRMKTVLIMIKLLQLRMKDNQFVFEGDHGAIPSCIETAAVNVVYHPFSRQLSNMWVRASNALNVDYPEFVANNKFSDITSLLPVALKESDLVLAHDPLLPCFGWIFENLMEINKCPNFHRNTINFNKRYLVYKIIKELSVEDVDDGASGSNTSLLETGEFDFLFKLDESLCQTVNLARITGAERVKIPLFRGLLREQAMINESEQTKRSAGVQSRSNAPVTGGNGGNGSDQIHRVTRRTSSNLKRQSLSYKTNASSRFKISGLFNRLNTGASEKTVEFWELPEAGQFADAKSKPAHVIAMKDKKIFPVYLLSNCFKVDSEHSTEAAYFRAPNEAEMKDWLGRLNFANRHWFMSRAINTRVTAANTTFCIPLAALCERDGTTTPRLLDTMYEAIEANGIEEVGIYRISASLTELASIKQEIDRTGHVDLETRHVDVHALTSCVKLFFRDLPDSVFTDSVMDELFRLTQASQANGEDTSGFVEALAAALRRLPPANYHTLKALVSHLHRVSCHSDKNRMTSSNLATVIGPALTEAASAEVVMSNFGFTNIVLERLIDRCTDVFS